jgi:hypothetical protein
VVGICKDEEDVLDEPNIEQLAEGVQDGRIRRGKVVDQVEGNCEHSFKHMKGSVRCSAIDM